MKTRKIWSIPIAAMLLAMALLMAGLFATTLGVVQADSPSETLVLYTGTTAAVAKHGFAKYVSHADIDAAGVEKCELKGADVDGLGNGVANFFTAISATGIGRVGCDIKNGDGTLAAGADYSFTLEITDKAAVPVIHIIKIQVKSGLEPTGPTPTPTAVPTTGLKKAIDDVELELTGSTLDSDESVTLATHFEGVNAYTVLVGNTKIVIATLNGDYNTEAAGNSSVVQSWWDSLTNTERRAAVGDKSLCSGSVSPATDSNFCTTYNAKVADAAAGTPAEVGLAANEKLAVTQAFHWDILTGAEMAAAVQAGLDGGVYDSLTTKPVPANYKKGFADLSAGQRMNVQKLYDTVLYRSQGATLKVSSLDKKENIGTSSVTVKASDKQGLFLADSIGDSFDVKVNGLKLPDLFIMGGTQADDDIPEHFLFAIESDAKEVGTIKVIANSAKDAVGHNDKVNGTYDAIRARLNDGASFPFRVNAVGTRGDKEDSFVIKVEGALDVSRGRSDPYVFQFETYAASDITNSDYIQVRVVVAVGDQKPTFVANSPTKADVSEIEKVGYEIATFVAVDPDNTTGITYSVSDNRGLPDNRFEIGSTSGVLTLKSPLDYCGDEEAKVGKTPDCNKATDNAIALTITADDGGLIAEHTFTVTVTDSPLKPPTVKTSFSINENTGNKVKDADGNDIAARLVDADGADVQVVLLKEDDGNTAESGYKIKGIGIANLDSIVALFAISDDGLLSLQADKNLNYEVDRRYLLAVKAEGGATGFIDITILDVQEAPVFTDAPTSLRVDETANIGDPVNDTKETADLMDDVPAVITAKDDDVSLFPTTYTLRNVDGTLYGGGLFRIGLRNGKVTVMGSLDHEATGSTVMLKVRASDPDMLTTDHPITITIGDANETPNFISPAGGSAEIDKDENEAGLVIGFTASDPDGDDLSFTIREGAASALFEIGGPEGEGNAPIKDANDVWSGSLKVKPSEGLDYEEETYNADTGYRVHVEVQDNEGLSDTLAIDVFLKNLDDNPPIFDGSGDGTEMVPENTRPGMPLGDYSATDADNLGPITYDLIGANAKSFQISDTGMLMTLEALDADRPTPCGATGCHLEVIASDGMGDDDASMSVIITVTDVQDSISNFNFSKANPLPGVTMGDEDTALGDAKEMIEGSGVPESPADLPATDGDEPMNFVDTQWANWGTVLRIEVTSISPGPAVTTSAPNACRGGNECVKITLKSDSGDETLVLEAYRGAKDNVFIAAVMPVSGEGVNGDYSMESSVDAYKRMNPGASAPSMYKHPNGGGVARLEVDEEDEITIEFGNLRGTIDVENENPEFGNFAPEHESAFDDGDVDYTFTVIDPVSGIPDPEDLPDIDGDDDYMPVVAVISVKQCHTVSSANLDPHIGGFVYCGSAPEIREIVDDRDFDEIDDGFEVDTKIVLPENKVRYVSFIACDAAGNCAMYTPDENETEEALAEITIDTKDPVLKEVRTGIKWDATDSEYDDDRSFVQVLFEDLTALNPDTIEADDFVVEGHTIKDVHWYDVSDNDDDTAWGDDDKSTTPSRFAMGGLQNLRNKHPLRQSIRNAVFIELEDELAADETPDVTVVPNGIEDSAGNEQDDGDEEAQDWIAPSFTVVSIVSPRTPEGSSNVLAGDGDEVVVTLTVDERIQQTRPNVSVDYVNAPVNCVNTANRTEKNPYDRGEIKTKTKDNNCGSSAVGGDLKPDFEKVSNTEWIVTIDEPDDTGYYNFYVSANDRSKQGNKGSEGIARGDIVVDFFERDGDVNSDDAHYFQGDINLGNPGVRVSGVQIEDTEPTVEFKTPLFVELDFTRPYIAECDDDVDNDDRDANCLAESDEYAKDSFDSVTVTSFVLNGVDMTDSVKTTDDETFLVSIVSIGIGDHEIEVQAMDQAGNTLDKSLSIEFEVEERDPFSRRLNPGWNLVSLPGEPADSDISVVFGSNVEVRTVYTYDPIIPGGWMVAVRETLDSDWQGDLMDITARRGYWVLSDAIQDWEVSIPRLAGGAVGSGTPIQPPVIGLYAGWNLIPVVDVRGGALDDKKSISATAYLNSLDDGLDLARVLGFNTITNTWTTVLDPDDTSADAGELRIGSGYWVFVREAASLVPGGIAQ